MLRAVEKYSFVISCAQLSQDLKETKGTSFLLTQRFLAPNIISHLKVTAISLTFFYWINNV